MVGVRSLMSLSIGDELEGPFEPSSSLVFDTSADEGSVASE